MRRSGLLAVLVSLPLITGSSAQEKPPEPTPPAAEQIPPEAVQRKNPIAASEESVSLGKRLFGSQCAMCHGEKGDGKGDLAAEMQLKTPDFRAAEKMKQRTDGALFYIVTEGRAHTPMPAQGGRLTQAQRWHLINYIRTLAQPAQGEKPAQPPSS